MQIRLARLLGTGQQKGHVLFLAKKAYQIPAGWRIGSGRGQGSGIQPIVHLINNVLNFYFHSLYLDKYGRIVRNLLVAPFVFL